jgi:hypothetical protein
MPGMSIAHSLCDELELLVGGPHELPPLPDQVLRPGRRLPLQTPDTLAEELVQVAGGDRQEAEALQWEDGGT